MNLVSNFLVGPTASGKSEIAHQLAIKNNQCIVSADSMNVYRCMNIGTAKPPEKYLNEIIYYGVDIIDLTNSFSVMHWKKSVEKAWKEEKNIPITTGGTGLYIKCLLEGINPEENKNKQLRDYLESLSLKELQNFILCKYPNSFKELNLIDQKNPRRLIRAVERIPSEKKWLKKDRPLVVGLYLERKTLHDKIEKRVLKMFDDGLISEAKKLRNLSLSRTAYQAIGYKESFDFIDGNISKDDCIYKTIIRTRQLAKRQLTWFKNQMNVRWVDISNLSKTEDIVNAVEMEWQKIGPTKITL